MENVDVFSVRDLRVRSGDLLRDAENGKVSLITKYGKPAILAIPFDERLLAHGVHQTLALNLFEAELVSLSKAAKIADLSLEGFLDLLAQYDIPAASYTPEELSDELKASW